MSGHKVAVTPTMAPPSANEVVAGGKDDQVANSGDKPVPVPTPPIVRNLILRSMCGVYLVAFLSFYAQAEGEKKCIKSVPWIKMQEYRLMCDQPVKCQIRCTDCVSVFSHCL